MKAVRVVIQRYVVGANPGWVECSFVDAFSREVRFVEKVPVVAEADLGPDSTYPQAGVVACRVLEVRCDSAGREIARITTAEPWGVETAEGRTEFEVPSDLLLEI